MKAIGWSEVTDLTGNVILLDRVLAHYGAETKEARDLLRRSVHLTITQLWPEPVARLELTPDGGLDAVHDRIQALSGRDESHRALKVQALSILASLTQARWLLLTRGERAVPSRAWSGGRRARSRRSCRPPAPRSPP